MSMPLADYHVHSTFSDDATATVAENLAAARARGLRTICLSDHVRDDTGWLDQYVAEVRRAGDGADIEVLCGVEVKMLDQSGRLDLPPSVPDLDRVLIADHQYPGPHGPEAPGAVKARIDVGMMTPEETVDGLVDATVNAIGRTAEAGHRPQLAHLFSLLPKLGLDESDVDSDQLDRLARACRDGGAAVEVNEKWGCPGPAAIAAFRAAGVELVPSSDSHQAEDVGRYERVPALLA
jgi:putative hydrolase